VSLETIAKAERIAMKYNHQVIQYNFGDEVWLDCVEKDHSNQIMCQILVTGFIACTLLPNLVLLGPKGRLFTHQYSSKYQSKL